MLALQMPMAMWVVVMSMGLVEATKPGLCLTP
jgi:hypothetical protein